MDRPPLSPASLLALRLALYDSGATSILSIGGIEHDVTKWESLTITARPMEDGSITAIVYMERGGEAEGFTVEGKRPGLAEPQG